MPGYLEGCMLGCKLNVLNFFCIETDCLQAFESLWVVKHDDMEIRKGAYSALRI